MFIGAILMSVKSSERYIVSRLPAIVSSLLAHWKWSYSVGGVRTFVLSVQKYALTKKAILRLFQNSEKRLPKLFNWHKKFVVVIIYSVTERMSRIRDLKLVMRPPMTTLISAWPNWWFRQGTSENYVVSSQFSQKSPFILWKRNWKPLKTLISQFD